ncbi:ParA family protein [Zhenhengia yiwuensis]|uniref:ParA family protein n=1 Tax=Zhenhengia yiwuensis TaxID=2763666 RepID=A0A926IFP3_9FIRM|nr:ParA family protein [Zhenhengia yiwuensis]MBC8581093.1 ParA family protein [Zhenhengia yiwuensis]
MKIISIINLKGGVAKTISSVNMAHILATVHNKRVLIIDNDKQGNASKMFGMHSYEHKGTEALMIEKDLNMEEVIRKTDYENLDIVCANMNLLKANLEVVLDQSRVQQTRFRKALNQVKDKYDYCIIDNAPDINISTINALVASEDVLIPVKIDDFAFDGLKEIKEQIEATKEDLNQNLNLKGCFITQFMKNEVNLQGKEYLNLQDEYPVFKTHIRRTEKIDESTFAKMPIVEYSRRCGAARDYLELVSEYLEK